MDKGGLLQWGRGGCFEMGMERRGLDDISVCGKGRIREWVITRRRGGGEEGSGDNRVDRFM